MNAKPTAMLLLSYLASQLACSSKGGATLTDAAAPADAQDDASTPDASPPDAMVPCPGELSLEYEVASWSTLDSIAGATALHEGSSRQASSAPNGRLGLCVPNAPFHRLALSHADHLDHAHQSSTTFTEKSRTSGLPLQLQLLQAGDRQALYSSVSQTLNPAMNTVVVELRDRATFAPMPGIALTLDAVNDGSFVPSGREALTPSTTTDDKGQLLFLNLPSDAAFALLSPGANNCEAISPSPRPLGGILSLALLCDTP